MIKGKLLTSVSVKNSWASLLVSLYFTIRQREWSGYYYKIGVCGGRVSYKVIRVIFLWNDLGWGRPEEWKEKRGRRPSWDLGLAWGRGMRPKDGPGWLPCIANILLILGIECVLNTCMLLYNVSTVIGAWAPKAPSYLYFTLRLSHNVWKKPVHHFNFAVMCFVNNKYQWQTAGN